MLRWIGICVFVTVCSLSYGQNLVPNPSFEDTISCPTNGNQVGLAVGWYNPNPTSPDYFHSCNNSIPSVSTPINIFGHQAPRSGSAYVGIGQLPISQPNAREYIACKLNEPLTASEYCVTFYVSLAGFSGLSVNNVGAVFTQDSLLDDPFFDLAPMIVNETAVLSDTSNWMEIQGSFTAVGGEQFLTIGVFQDSTYLDITYLSGNPEASYHYVDDVSVTLGSCSPDTNANDTTTYLTIPNVFTPNKDGVNDVFRIDATGYSDLECAVFSRWGQRITTFNAISGHWDGYTQAGLPVPDGIYYYVITGSSNERESVQEKGTIHLLRQ